MAKSRFVYRKRWKQKSKDFEQGRGQQTVSFSSRSGMSQFKRKRGSFYRKVAGAKHWKKRDFW